MGADTVMRAAKKRLFLLDYAVHGNIWHAAKHAKIDRQTHYNWVTSDEDYKRQFERAKEDFVDAIEDEIRRRATKKKTPSDVLLIFLAKKLNPEFRDSHNVAVTGAQGEPLSIKVEFVKAGDKP
jgi:hypothetical protein